MGQSSKSKKFNSLLSGNKKTPVNSGIFTSPQQKDAAPKPSYGKKPNLSVHKAAVDSSGGKVGITHSKGPKSAAAVQKYAK